MRYMTKFITCLLTTTFVWGVDCQREIVDPEPGAFTQLMEKNHVSFSEAPVGTLNPASILNFDCISPISDTGLTLQLVYLSPEASALELEDMRAIRRGEEPEVRGWQKLTHYLSACHEIAVFFEYTQDRFPSDNVNVLYTLYQNRLAMLEKIVGYLCDIQKDKDISFTNLSLAHRILREDMSSQYHDFTAHLNSQALRYVSQLLSPVLDATVYYNQGYRTKDMVMTLGIASSGERSPSDKASAEEKELREWQKLAYHFYRYLQNDSIVQGIFAQYDHTLESLVLETLEPFQEALTSLYQIKKENGDTHSLLDTIQASKDKFLKDIPNSTQPLNFNPAFYTFHDEIEDALSQVKLLIAHYCSGQKVDLSKIA